MKALRSLLLIALLLANAPATFAQETAPESRLVRLVLNDGTIKEGRFIAIDADYVVLELEQLGVTRFPKFEIQVFQDIESLSAQSSASRNRAFAPNPQASRYFFAPSGMQLQAGEGYFQSNIGLNSVSYGVTDALTVGGLVSVLGGGGSFKVGKAIGERTAISAGAIGFADFYGLLDQPLGLAFVNITRGNDRSNVTLNVGFGNKERDQTVYRNFVQNTFGDFVPSEEATFSSRPFIANLSAMAPLGDARWLLTENYLIKNRVEVGQYGPVSMESLFYRIPDGWPLEEGASWESGSTGILSLGIRSLNRRSGWLWDYGLVGVFAGDGDGFAAPWFSFTLAF